MTIKLREDDLVRSLMYGAPIIIIGSRPARAEAVKTARKMMAYLDGGDLVHTLDLSNVVDIKRAVEALRDLVAVIEGRWGKRTPQYQKAMEQARAILDKHPLVQQPKE